MPHYDSAIFNNNLPVLDIWVNAGETNPYSDEIKQAGGVEPDRDTYVVFCFHNVKLLNEFKKIKPNAHFTVSDSSGRIKYFVYHRGTHKASFAIEWLIDFIDSGNSNGIFNNDINELNGIKKTFDDQRAALPIPRQSIYLENLTVESEQKEVVDKKINQFSRGVTTFTHNGYNFVLKKNKNSLSKQTEIEVLMMMIARFIVGPDHVPFAFSLVNKEGQRLGTVAKKIHSLGTVRSLKADKKSLPTKEEHLVIQVLAYLLKDGDMHSGNVGYGEMDGSSSESMKYFDFDRMAMTLTAKYYGRHFNERFNYCSHGHKVYIRTPENAFRPTTIEIENFPALNSSRPRYWPSGTGETINHDELGECHSYLCGYTISYSYQKEKYFYFTSFLILDYCLDDMISACLQSEAAREKFLKEFRESYIAPVRKELCMSEDFKFFFNKHRNEYKKRFFDNIDSSAEEIRTCNDHQGWDLFYSDLDFDRIEELFLRLGDDIQSEVVENIKITLREIIDFLSKNNVFYDKLMLDSMTKNLKELGNCYSDIIKNDSELPGFINEARLKILEAERKVSLPGYISRALDNFFGKIERATTNESIDCIEQDLNRYCQGSNFKKYANNVNFIERKNKILGAIEERRTAIKEGDDEKEKQDFLTEIQKFLDILSVEGLVFAAVKITHDEYSEFLVKNLQIYSKYQSDEDVELACSKCRQAYQSAKLSFQEESEAGVTIRDVCQLSPKGSATFFEPESSDTGVVICEGQLVGNHQAGLSKS